MNDFEEEIKQIKSEILALKTASAYTTIRSADFTSTILVSQGLYRVTYASEPVYSFCYIGTDVEDSGLPFPRTPEGNTQVIEIRYDEDSAPLTIVSNVPILSITRI